MSCRYARLGLALRDPSARGSLIEDRSPALSAVTRRKYPGVVRRGEELVSYAFDCGRAAAEALDPLPFPYWVVCGADGAAWSAAPTTERLLQSTVTWLRATGFEDWKSGPRLSP